MLDMKRTFDEVVLAHSTPERAQAILENPFYQSLSSSFSGTQEYMAMEKLGQLRAEDRWDLIVVDTPPSRSALDFLDAPKRLGSFLDGRFIRILMAPRAHGRPRLPQGARRRARRGHRRADQDPRRPGAQGPADLRRGPGHDVRRLPGAGRRDLPAAEDVRHGLRRGRRPGAGRAAGGVLLRRAARHRGHAARRAWSSTGCTPPARSRCRRPGPRPARRPWPRRASTRWRPACCGCTRSGCGSSSGSSRCAAGSPPRTPGCRWSTSRPSRATCTTWPGCATIGAALAGG